MLSIGSINNPTVALPIHQKRPKALNKTSLQMLEMETILLSTPMGANDTMTSPIARETVTVNHIAHETQRVALQAINSLATCIEELELSSKQTDCGPSRQQSKVTCRKCGEMLCQRVCH